MMAILGRIAVIVFFVCMIVDVTRCSHFRGGTMSWKPYGDPADKQIEVSYRLAWKADTNEGEHNCTFARVHANAMVEGGSGGLSFRYEDMPESQRYTRTQLRYACTSRLESSDYPQSLDRSWVMGENKIVHPSPPDGRLTFELVYESCCWVSSLINYSPPKNWDFVMSVDLEPREDTGTINHSPITSGLPVQRINMGCHQAVLNIPTYDEDGDDITCRWVSESLNECRSNCNSASVWPRRTFRINNRNNQCRLIVTPGGAAVGWYAIAIMIEDSSNGVIHSKIPFQFMLEITGDDTCFKPWITGPSADSCWILPVGETFSFNVTAQSNGTRISQIATTNVVGMQKSLLQQVPDNPLQYYVTLTWTPTSDQRGVSLLCFQPEDSNGLQGNQRCVDMSVGDERAPVPQGMFSNPQEGGQIRVENTAFEIVFDAMVSRPSQDSEVRILHASDKSEICNVKVESSPGDQGDGVIFDYDAILFSIPDGLLRTGVNYTLELPEGLARGYGSCKPWSKATSWDFFTGNGSAALTRPPTDRFMNFPQCFGSFMQIFIPKTMVPNEDPSNMHLSEPTCVGAEYNGTHFVIGTQYQYCGTNIRPVPDKSIISNTIRIAAITLPGHPHLTRHNATEINMVCEMTNDRITFVRLEADLPAVVYNRTSYGEFNFSLRMFPDENYEAKTQFRYADYPLQVKLEQRLYFEAKALIDSSLPYQIHLKSCEATPTPNPVDRLYYRFIEDGCALDDTLQYHTQARLKSRFSIEAFAFLGHFLSDSIFIHCDIQIEDNGNAHTCPVTDLSANRRRRHVHTRSVSQAMFNTDGPIRIVDTLEGKPYLRENQQPLLQASVGSFYVSVSALIVCVILIAGLVSMVTVMQKLKVQNRRLGKLVGRPPISLRSITEP